MEFDATRDVDSSPAVVDGRVYAGTDYKKLICLDAKTGSSIWEFPPAALFALLPWWLMIASTWAATIKNLLP